MSYLTTVLKFTIKLNTWHFKQWESAKDSGIKQLQTCKLRSELKQYAMW